MTRVRSDAELTFLPSMFVMSEPTLMPAPAAGLPPATWLTGAPEPAATWPVSVTPTPSTPRVAPMWTPDPPAPVVMWWARSSAVWIGIA